MVDMFLGPCIVLSKDTAKSEKEGRLVKSSCEIRKARQTFFFNPSINIPHNQHWGLPLGEMGVRLKLCVYVAVYLVCLSAWMAFLGFFFFLVSKICNLKILDRPSSFNTNTLTLLLSHGLGPAACHLSEVQEGKSKFAEVVRNVHWQWCTVQVGWQRPLLWLLGLHQSCQGQRL